MTSRPVTVHDQNKPAMANHRTAMKKPTKATTVGTIYLISNQAGLHKIGITQDWLRRSRELEVGTKTSAVLTATVIRPKALELALHRRHKAERLPQTEWFQLTQKQLQEVIGVIEAEAQKLIGPNADLQLCLDATIHEAEQLHKAGDRKAWEEKLAIAEQLRRQIDPEYNARAVAREEAAARASRLQHKHEAEHWNSSGWWQHALLTGAVLPALASIPVIGLSLIPVNIYAVARCGFPDRECGDAIISSAANTMLSIAGLAIPINTAFRLRKYAKVKREVEE